MSETYISVLTPIQRLQARGCGLLFFIFILIVGGGFGAGLGVFAYQMDKAKAQIATLDQFRPKIGSKVYADEGSTLLGEYNVENRQLLHLNEVPLILQKAIVAAEDAVFYEHKGVRPDAMLSVALDALRKGRIRGGSTITMQLARNAEEATGVSKERTPQRKLKEMITALQVEREFTKDEILELYLNQVFLGGNAHGVEAACETYFNKPCKNITIEEAATLAAILPSPNAYRPDLHPERAERQRNLVLDRMLEHGFVTKEEFDRAVATKVADYAFTPERRAAEAEKPDAKSAIVVPNHFAAPYFVREMKIRALRDKTLQMDDDKLLEGGYEIITTLDMRLQKAAEDALFKQLADYDEKKLKALQRAGHEEDFVPVQGALVCMDNRPGREGYVRALVGGRSWEDEQFNMATQALRQPGSSVKPFVWATALELGRNMHFSPTTIIVDEPFTQVGSNGQTWSPHNFSGEYSGPVTLRFALEKSINVVSVKLVQRFGVPAVKATIQSCFPEINIPSDVGLTIGLGTHLVTPLDQCAAYSTIAKGGIYTAPIFIESIKNRDGLEQWHCKIEPKQVMKPDVAYVLRHMMVGVANWGTGAASAPLKRPRAGKTGTTNNAVDVWFCGFTPEYTCVVWLGYKDNRSLGHGQEATGGHLAVPVWTQFMMAAHEGIDPHDFDVPAGSIEWHTVERQTLRGYQGGFNEAFIKGTYRSRELEEMDSTEEMMEKKSLTANY